MLLYLVSQFIDILCKELTFFPLFLIAILYKVVQGLDGGSKRSFIPFFGRSEKGLAHSLMEWIK